MPARYPVVCGVDRHDVPLAALLLAGGLLMWCGESLAQGTPVNRNGYTREQAREFIDEYATSLQDREYGNDDRRGPPTAGIPATTSPEMKQVRPLVHDFAELAAQLTYAMNDQMNRVPALRALYSDALTVSAEAASLDRRSATVGDHRFLLDDYGQLDADWREMAYRLKGVRGLAAETQDLIANLNELEQRIRKALNTQPQVNRQDVALIVAGIAGELQNLMDDIRAELGRSQSAQQLLVLAGRTRQQALTLVYGCRDDQLDSGSLVREYKQFEATWAALAAKLQLEENRYLQRSLRRVNQSNYQIHQLLLLPQVTDKSQVIYLTKTLKKDIDEFFTRTPLSLVILLPKSQRALPAANQFHSACDQFVDLVNRGDDQSSLVDAFRAIEEADRGFSEVFGQIDSDAAIAVLHRIEQTIGTIRAALHIEREDFDRNAAGELAAAIQNLTENVDVATRQWLASDSQSFSNACRQETAALANQAATVHNDLVRGVPISQLRHEVDDLYERWRTVYRYIVKCQTNDRPVLGRLSGRLTPAMVELRTLVAQPVVDQTAQRPMLR